jgi:hypothetical protein
MGFMASLQGAPQGLLSTPKVVRPQDFEVGPTALNCLTIIPDIDNIIITNLV